MILETAKELVYGDRAERYGEPGAQYKRLGEVWSNIFNIGISKEQVVLALIAMKLLRYEHNPHIDDLVDIAGYAAVLEKMRDA